MDRSRIVRDLPQRKIRKRKRRYLRLLAIIDELYENQRSIMEILGEHMVKICTLSRQLSVIREGSQAEKETI